MPRIHALSEDMVKGIAAGEVVEGLTVFSGGVGASAPTSRGQEGEGALAPEARPWEGSHIGLGQAALTL